MSASREKKSRKSYEEAAQAEKKSRASLIAGILAAVAAVLIIGAIILFKGPLFIRHSTAVTVGEHDLSPVTVHYFYTDYFNTFANQYGSLISYIFSDTSNIDDEIYDQETGETWGDYFMSGALNQMKYVYAIYDEAVANGYVLDPDQQSEIDSIETVINYYASLYSVSADDYVENIYGKGSTLDSYIAYETVCYTADAYESYINDNFTYTADELAAAYDEDPAAYNIYSYHSYFISADCDSDAEDSVKEAAMKDAKYTADAIAEAGSGDVTAYLNAVAENADDSSYLDGSATLLTGNSDSMADDIAAWVTDASRTAGDTDVIEADSGYYVLSFISCNTNDYNMVSARIIRIDAETDDDGNYVWEDAESELAAFQAEFDAAAALDDDFWSTAASTYSDDSTNSSGGLYEDIWHDYFDEAEIDEWLFDGRCSGDTVTVQTEDAYYFVYYVGEEGTYRDYLVENSLRDNDFSDWYNACIDVADPVQHNFGMGYVDRTLSYSAS